MPKPALERETRLSVRLPENLKAVIEQAASVLGQSVSEFTVSTLVNSSHSVLRQAEVTELSNRDRDRFLAALDHMKPNKALLAAAKRYKQRAS